MTVRKPRRIAVGLAVSLASIVPIAVAFPSGNVAAGAPVGVVSQSIKPGSRGDDVLKVQNALIDAGLLPSGSADGVFGAKTKSAVQKFQSAHGLNSSGDVDDATAIALGVKSSEFFGLKSGSNGAKVSSLQQKLQALGYSPGSVDGVYGSSTAYAVKMFQQSLGYLQTGKVNAATAAALDARSSGSGSTQASKPTPSDSSDPSKSTKSPSNATGSAKDYSTFRMSIGNSGTQVKLAQQVLLDLKYDVVGGADGYYGAMTANAMRSFQRDNGLVVDGVVGPNTARTLEKARQGSVGKASGSSTPSNGSIDGLATGATGAAVKTLQQRLLDVGVPLKGSVDGIFGPATAKAVRLFQGWNGIEQTGVVGAKTVAALNSAKKVSTSDRKPSGDSKPSGDIGYAVYGERGSRVTALQQKLVNAGISVKGGVDGAFGAGTSAAVMAFQRKHSLNVTGVVSEATASKLGLAKADKPKASTPAPSSSGGGYLKVFPVQGWCGFSDTWGAYRSGGRSHIGTDIIAAQGKEIYAIDGGVIEKIYTESSDRLAGNGVRLRLADGTYAFYAHMSQLGPGIGVGTPVQAGQVIGYVGSTGNAYTPHLHFELHPKGGSAVNPYLALKAINACTVTTPR